MGIKKAKKFLLTGLLVALCFTGGYLVGFNGFTAQFKSFPKVSINRLTPPEKNLDFSLFWRVWDNLSASYFDKTKLVPSQMVYGAIKGMVEAVGDPYTVFLPPSDNKISEEDLNGNFQGVGIQIGFKGTQLAVIAPLPESPAEKAGIKAGDLILGIKDDLKKVDQTTNGMTLPQAVALIRGQAGTKVTLALLREGSDKPLTIEVGRETINVPSVTVSYEGENKQIAHIKVLKFGGETASEWTKALTEIKAKKVTQIILDLRNNPGGYLQGAIDLASDFVPKGTTVVIEDRGEKKTEYKTEVSPKLTDVKTVILVNGGSASASEILAGALKDILKVKLIGEKTFGKGTIQEPQDLENGSGLHITIAKWLTPNGTWVNGNGLEPDAKVEDKSDTPEDEQLLEAIKFLKS